MKSKLQHLAKQMITPQHFEKWYQDILVAVPRILGGLMLSLEYGSSKFGMP